MAHPSEAIYTLDSIIHAYGQRTVLQIGSLSIRRGEIVALVGPSGAGKSTLLRLLNFLETPTSGRLTFAGQVVSSDVPLGLRRQVTTVFQRPSLLHASVWDNVAYGLRLRGVAPHPAVDGMLERVGLMHLAHHRAHTLSGGEMQRVALARALVFEPEVLLLDEPTANLDPFNVGLIEDIVRETNRVRQTTIVLVTHNVFQARRLAHRTGLLLAGRLIEIGETPRIFSAPRDERTAAFVRGDMVY